MERHTANGNRGFTLIELLVVMAIIATLMTLVTPQYFRQHTKAQETVLRHNLSSIRQALDQYRETTAPTPSPCKPWSTAATCARFPQTR